MAIYDVRSISQVGTSEPFELQVARGQIPGHSFVHKFGYNPNIGTSVETIWAQGGLYVYPTTASTMYISSSSTNDTLAGTGARTATVSGLDADFKPITVTVPLNGQAGVQLNGALNWYRVNRIVVNTAGSNGANAGVLYVGTEATPVGGVPTNKYATVAIGDNQTLMCIWTVPFGYTAYLHQKDVSSSSSAGKFAIFSLLARPKDGVFNIKDRVLLANNSTAISYWNPIPFYECTDIEVRAQADSAGGSITSSATLDITYIKNAGPL